MRLASVLNMASLISQHTDLAVRWEWTAHNAAVASDVQATTAHTDTVAGKAGSELRELFASFKADIDLEASNRIGYTISHPH